MASPGVSIVILNWNGGRDTVECLESLYRMSYPDYAVIIVDNHSEDDSLVLIKDWARGREGAGSGIAAAGATGQPLQTLEFRREEVEAGNGALSGESGKGMPWREKLRLIKNERNYGYAEGNNIGIRYALSIGSDYVLLLNNDTVADPGLLTELVKAAQDNPGAGCLGAKIYYYNDPQRIWFAGGDIFWLAGNTRPLHAGEMDKGQADRIIEVGFVTGCAMMMTREALVKTGLFDGVYFAYFEDADWCMRSRAQGFRCIYTPEAKLWHKVSSSFNYQSPQYNYYFARNRIIFMKRYGKKIYLPGLYLVQVVWKSFRALLIFGIARRDWEAAWAYVRGVIDGIRFKDLHVSQSIDRNLEL